MDRGTEGPSRREVEVASWPDTFPQCTAKGMPLHRPPPTHTLQTPPFLD